MAIRRLPPDSTDTTSTDTAVNRPAADYAAGGYTVGAPSTGGATTGATTQPNTVTGPAVPGAAPPPPAPAAPTGGLDPNNPIDAIFMQTGYKQNGIGSGFGDLDYWRQHSDQAQRLLADQMGYGTDQPGPGDYGAALNSGKNQPSGQGGGSDMSAILAAINGLHSSAGQGSGSSSSSASSSSGPSAGSSDVMSALKGLFPNGAFNQSLVDQQTGSAHDTLERARKSQLATDQAELANRGLSGSGIENSSQGRLDQNIADTYSNQVGNIYANESNLASQRMISALQMATGMTEQDASLAVQSMLGEGQLALGNKTADNNFTLGSGNLALGNKNADNNFALGEGQLGLGFQNSGNQLQEFNAGNQFNYDQLNSQNQNTANGQNLTALQLWLQQQLGNNGGYL